jgi:predicted TPR repeat methyltransferase
MNLHYYYDGFWKAGGRVPVLVDLSSYKVESINKIFDSQEKKILDLGCGDGRTGSAFVGRDDVCGIDFLEKAAEEARKKGPKRRSGTLLRNFRSTARN